MSRPLRCATGPGRALAGMALAVLLAGCGSFEEEVGIVLPLHRLDLPETPGRAVHLGHGTTAETFALSLTEDQGGTPPSAAEPKKGDSGGVLVHAEVHPWRRLGLVVEVGDYADADDRTHVRAKLHLLGPSSPPEAGDFSLAATIGYTHDDESHEGLSASTRVEARGRDYALIGGLRLSRAILLYGGPYRQRMSYRAWHHDQMPPGGGPPTTTLFRGTGELEGYNVGLSFHPGVRWISLLLEHSRGTLEAGGVRMDEDSFNTALRFNFGWRVQPQPEPTAPAGTAGGEGS